MRIPPFAEWLTRGRRHAGWVMPAAWCARLPGSDDTAPQLRHLDAEQATAEDCRRTGNAHGRVRLDVHGQLPRSFVGGQQRVDKADVRPRPRPCPGTRCRPRSARRRGRWPTGAVQRRGPWPGRGRQRPSSPPNGYNDLHGSTVTASHFQPHADKNVPFADLTGSAVAIPGAARPRGSDIRLRSATSELPAIPFRLSSRASPDRAQRPTRVWQIHAGPDVR